MPVHFDFFITAKGIIFWFVEVGLWVMKMAIKNRFKEVVDNSGYKQKFIAKETGLTQTTVSAVYKGQIPHLENALKLARFFGLRVEDIWSLEDE